MCYHHPNYAANTIFSHNKHIILKSCACRIQAISITALITKTQLIHQTYCSAGWHLNWLSRMNQSNKKGSMVTKMRFLIVICLPDFWKVLARNPETAFLTRNNLSILVDSDKMEMTKEVPKRNGGCKNWVGKNTYWTWSFAVLHVRAVSAPSSATSSPHSLLTASL